MMLRSLTAALSWFTLACVLTAALPILPSPSQNGHYTPITDVEILTLYRRAPPIPSDHFHSQHTVDNSRYALSNPSAGYPSERASFTGKIAAHTTEKMTPAQLSKYAEHAHAVLHEKFPARFAAHPVIVAATHREGDDVVRFHTTPYGHDWREHQDKNPWPLTKGMEKGKLAEKKGDQWHFSHHAETAVLRKSLKERGIANTAAEEDLAHHTIGVYGHNSYNRLVTAPCHDKCHPTLNFLGVSH